MLLKFNVTQLMTCGAYFQDMRRAGNKGERLGLTDLLAKPHQRIPRYRLLIQVSLNGLSPKFELNCFFPLQHVTR